MGGIGAGVAVSMLVTLILSQYEPTIPISKISPYAVFWAALFTVLVFLPLMISSALFKKGTPTEDQLKEIDNDWRENEPNRPLREYIRSLTTHAETIFHMRLNSFLVGEAFLFAALFTATSKHGDEIRSFVRLLPILGTVVTYSFWFAIIRAEEKLVYCEGVLDSICALYYFHRRRIGDKPAGPERDTSNHSPFKAVLDGFKTWLNKSYILIAWLAPAIALWAWLVVMLLIVPEHLWIWIPFMLFLVGVFSYLEALPKSFFRRRFPTGGGKGEEHDDAEPTDAG
jgi:hypothetical protein